MNIRHWFNTNANIDNNSEGNKSLNKLLKLYCEAMYKYFGVDKDSTDAKNIFELIELVKFNPATDSFFIDWLQEKGIKKLQEITKENIEENLATHIDYEYYILKEEMDFLYPEDVRSQLISITNDLFTLIKNNQ